MRVKSVLIFLLFWSLLPLTTAQWSNDFEGNDFDAWSGDVANFEVVDGVLNLNAAEAGSSYISRPSEITADSIVLSMDLVMDFSPSDNNRLDVFLALDNEDFATASGYYLRMGQNGSDDAIQLYALNSGSASLLAEGRLGGIAQEPVNISLRLEKFDDFVTVFVDYNNDGFLEEDIMFSDSNFSFSDSRFFAIRCSYTASRADKFSFDNLSLQKFEADKEPPTVASYVITSSKTVEITFNESIDNTLLLNEENYDLESQGSPESIQSLNAFNSAVELTFATDFLADKPYNLTISNLADTNGNAIATPFVLPIIYARAPKKGDLLLSEILFDPPPSGEDYLEVYNNSNDFLELQGIQIVNQDRDNETEVIENSVIIGPEEYLACTEDVDFVIEQYRPQDENTILTQDIPAFNNDSGNITLINSDQDTLDVFDYDEDYHLALLNDAEGVSLERLAFDQETNQAANWQSAAQIVNFGTPGYANSTAINIGAGDEMFNLEYKTFSPNLDGDRDVLILTYNLEKPGFVGNVYIYDSNGHQIKRISNNEVLASSGFLTWDGTDMDSNRVNIGIYIIAGEIFHPDGDVLSFKKACVLADFLK